MAHLTTAIHTSFTHKNCTTGWEPLSKEIPKLAPVDTLHKQWSAPKFTSSHSKSRPAHVNDWLHILFRVEGTSSLESLNERRACTVPSTNLYIHQKLQELETSNYISTARQEIPMNYAMKYRHQEDFEIISWLTTSIDGKKKHLYSLRSLHITDVR